MQQIVTYLKKRILKKSAKSKNYWKVRGKYRGAAHIICNLRFNVPNKISAVFQIGTNYDYYFIIK